MTTKPFWQSGRVPLRLAEGGAVKVGKTRVSLDSVIGAYEQGDSAEEIVYNFPTLDLADVHLIIAFYLRRRDDVNRYLVRRRREAEKLQAAIEAKQGNRRLKQRLLSRRRALQGSR